MEAITRLEKSGLTVSQIARLAGLQAPAIRRWKRNECTPGGKSRERLTKLAQSRGILLLGSDFNKSD